MKIPRDKKALVDDYKRQIKELHDKQDILFNEMIVALGNDELLQSDWLWDYIFHFDNSVPEYSNMVENAVFETQQ